MLHATLFVLASTLRSCAPHGTTRLPARRYRALPRCRRSVLALAEEFLMARRPASRRTVRSSMHTPMANTSSGSLCPTPPIMRAPRRP